MSRDDKIVLRTETENENCFAPREGWKLATEVARTARQHPDKRANKRKVNLPSYQDGGSPK